MRAQNTLFGVGWMLLTTLLLASVTAIVAPYRRGSACPRRAPSFAMPPARLMMLPLIGRAADTSPLRPDLHLHLLRGAVHGVGVILWFYAMARIPMAEVTALGYVAPIFITIGAALFLGETLHMRRVFAVVAGGTAGASCIITLRPGFQEILDGARWRRWPPGLFLATFFLIIS